MPTFVKEVLPEHRMCSFIYILNMAASAIQQTDRLNGPRVENIYYLALCRKRLPMPDLKGCQPYIMGILKVLSNHYQNRI